MAIYPSSERPQPDYSTSAPETSRYHWWRQWSSAVASSDCILTGGSYKCLIDLLPNLWCAVLRHPTTTAQSARIGLSHRQQAPLSSAVDALYELVWSWGSFSELVVFRSPYGTSVKLNWAGTFHASPRQHAPFARSILVSFSLVMSLQH